MMCREAMQSLTSNSPSREEKNFLSSALMVSPTTEPVSETQKHRSECLQ